MITLTKGNAAAERFLKDQKLSQGARYRWLAFVYPYQDGERRLVYNLLTNRLCRMENGDVPFGKDVRFSAGEVRQSPELSMLMRDYYLVREDEDDSRLYENLVRLARAVQPKQPKGLSVYTILPTMACNARCFYCFEQGYPVVTMSPETAEATADFILRTKRDGKLTLNWFGGEPLLRPDIIDGICQRLRADGAEFESMVTTNGSLIDEALIARMKDNWNLVKAQVSLDGEENEYVRRKAYINLPQPYPLVMRNIGLLLNAGVRVNLRCNIDRDNLPTVPLFLCDIDRRFPDKSALSLEFVSLYGNNGTDDELTLYKACDELRLEAEKLQLYARKRFSERSLRLHYCIAQEPNRHTVISPEGKLYCCEHCTAGTETGNVRDGFTNQKLLKLYASQGTPPEKCRGCVFLPACTAFTLCDIKNTSLRCREIQENSLLIALRRTAEGLDKEVL